MPGTVSYLNHEPLWVVHGSSATLLGFSSEGDITVSFNEEWVDQMTHQTGAYVLESYHKGGPVTIEVSLAEINNWDNWVEAFPTGEKQVDTDTVPNARFSPHKLAANTPYIGTKATAVASDLILRPVADYVDVSTETTRDLTFPLAWCRNVDAIPFGIDTPSELALTFGVLFDPAATSGEHTWIRGLMSEVTGAWAAA